MHCDRQPIAQAVNSAPSPDNNQPWSFLASDEFFDIRCDFERSLPSDVNCMVDMTAIGAALENACLVGEARDAENKVEWLPTERLKADEVQLSVARLRTGLRRGGANEFAARRPSGPCL